jgi:hypothetical protein
LPTQKALASFLAKRGNAGMAVPFQIPRMKKEACQTFPKGEFKMIYADWYYTTLTKRTKKPCSQGFRIAA